MQDSLTNQVSALLEEAKELEDKARPSSDHAPLQKQEQLTKSWAALEQSHKKYIQACFLMKGHEEFTQHIEHYERHAQQLLFKAEGLKISDKHHQPKKKISFGRKKSSSHNDNADKNVESNGKKKVSVRRASEGLRNASLAGKKILKKAKGTTLKLVSQPDQNKQVKKTNHVQDCIQSDWVCVLETEKYADNADRLLKDALDNDKRGDSSKAITQYLNAVKYYSHAIKILSSEKGDEMETVMAPGESSVQSPESPTSTAQDKLAVMRQKSSQALDRVERLKRSIIDQASVQDSKTNQPGKLTRAEIEILKWSSHITSGVFLPWSDDEALRFNETPTRSWLTPSENDLITLSDKQKEMGCVWARPSEIAAMRGRKPCPIAMVNSKITPYTIKQYCVSDCSFIAGLCISAAFEDRFDRRLVSSLIYPQDPTTGMPIHNPQGVYMVKLWLNGVARRVLVDDLLPADRQGNLLCSHTTGSGNSSVLELWVPILEKAYIKLCGGYDFPGSNSGVDLFCLTGWIPERLFLPRDPAEVRDSELETPAERAWERLQSANSFGDCLITLSTSKELSDEQAEEVGLFTDHAYAVLGVVQTSTGMRLLQLKNPWAFKSWKSRFSPEEEDSWNSKVGYEASQYDDGVFWMSWDDILLYFRSIHLSWNPALFQFRTTIHGYWPKDLGPKDDSCNFGENPQYTITLSDEAIDSKATIWILLSRHVTKQEQEGGELSGFLALHIHRAKNPQQRVWCPNSNRVQTGTYTNNQHVLVKYDASGHEDRNLSIVLSQCEKTNDLAFTLSCYCTEKFELGDPERTPPVYQELSGSWKLRNSLEDKSKLLLAIGTAGGPLGKGSFGSNPQWSIRVPSEGARIQVNCIAPKTMHVNIILARTRSSNPQQGDDNEQLSRRIHYLHEDPIIDTGPHGEEFAASEITFLPAGLYTLCASSEVGRVGNFLLRVFSSNEVHICKING